MKKPIKKLKEKQFIATPGGLMCCSLPEFEASAYKGLKQNCGRVSKFELKKREKAHDRWLR